MHVSLQPPVAHPVAERPPYDPERMLHPRSLQPRSGKVPNAPDLMEQVLHRRIARIAERLNAVYEQHCRQWMRLLSLAAAPGTGRRNAGF